MAQARVLIRFLNELALPRPVFSAILKETFDHQEKQLNACLFHDDLSEFNESLLFVDFIERASRHRLKFLSEADYCDMAVWNADSPAGQFLLKVGAEDVIVQQQYRDFLIFRRFRQTLLCREEASPTREPDPEVLRSLYVGASARPKSEGPDIAWDDRCASCSKGGGEVATPHPLQKQLFSSSERSGRAGSGLPTSSRPPARVSRRPGAVPPRPRTRRVCSASSSALSVRT